MGILIPIKFNSDLKVTVGVFLEGWENGVGLY